MDGRGALVIDSAESYRYTECVLKLFVMRYANESAWIYEFVLSILLRYICDRVAVCPLLMRAVYNAIMVQYSLK